MGTWLVESFLWANERLQLESGVTVLSRDPAASLRRAPHWAGHPALSFCVGDVRNFAFPAGPFSHVIHAATEASPRVMAEDPLQVFDINVAGTRRVLEFAASCGARKFLLTSTGAVYGRQPPELALLPESFGGAADPTDLSSPYAAAGEAKRAAETLCALYWKQHGVETRMARCFTFAGPRLPLDGKFAIGNFIRDALRGGPIIVRGDGTPGRSYLYAADLAIWLWTILFRGQPCRPYNVGSESEVTIARLAQTVSAVFRRPRGVQLGPPADRRKPPDRYVPATERARTELGVAETIGLAKRSGGRCSGTIPTPASRSSTLKKISDFIADTLVAHGIRHVFMVTGGGAMHLNDSFGKTPGLEYVCCHHEQACAMAAEAYARVTGRMAAVCVTSGPGGTNALTGVFGAWTDSMPMLVISGQVRFDTTVRSTGLNLRQLGDQEFDIVRAAAAMTKYAVMVTDASTIRYHLERALHLARSGRPARVGSTCRTTFKGR